MSRLQQRAARSLRAAGWYSAVGLILWGLMLLPAAREFWGWLFVLGSCVLTAGWLCLVAARALEELDVDMAGGDE